MKKINKLLLTAVLLTGISITPASANGDATYAVVDSSGTVTNVIVCQISVCGSSGSWGGTMPNDTPWAGQRLVLQVPANPVTGQNQGAFMGTPENPVKYDSQAQVFTQGSAPITRSETIETTTVTATIHSDTVSFGPSSFVDGQMQFTPVVTSNTGATISATEGLVKEMAMFETPKTRAQLETSITNKLLVIQKYLNRFYTLLNGWILD